LQSITAIKSGTTEYRKGSYRMSYYGSPVYDMRKRTITSYTGNYAETFVGKHSHFFGQLEPNLFYKAYYKENVTKKVKEFLIDYFK
jgi:hypothetical protein